MAKNKVQDGKILNLPVIVGTLSGMGAVVGTYLHGVAQTDRDASGNAVIDLGPSTYMMPVYPHNGSAPSPVAVGDPLYWDASLTPDNLSKNPAGVFFGVALTALAASPLALGQVEVMVMHVSPGTAPADSFLVKFAGKTPAVLVGDSPAATIVVTANMAGILDTDLVQATLVVNGAVEKAIASIAIVSGTSLTFTASGAGFVTGDVISYSVLRAA